MVSFQFSTNVHIPVETNNLLYFSRGFRCCNAHTKAVTPKICCVFIAAAKRWQKRRWRRDGGCRSSGWKYRESWCWGRIIFQTSQIILNYCNYNIIERLKYLLFNTIYIFLTKSLNTIFFINIPYIFLVSF
jgi:hypothetical protein